MRVNVEKVLERDQKLSELDHRADALQHGASQFEQQAGKLKRKQWWANVKMMIIMGVIGVVLLIIIIGESQFSYLLLWFSPSGAWIFFNCNCGSVFFYIILHSLFQFIDNGYVSSYVMSLFIL